MFKNEVPKIALVGNPNSGKSSLFNHLTGLNQKIGNFPGVTVDKKTGLCRLDADHKVEIIDLPGTYSIYPNSTDEKVVFDILGDKTNPLYPDAVVVIVDASNFKRNLLLFTQIHDLNIPAILVLNMMDIVEKTGLSIDEKALSNELGVPVIPMKARRGNGVAELKQAIIDLKPIPFKTIFEVRNHAAAAIDAVKEIFTIEDDYVAYQLLQQYTINQALTANEKNLLADIIEKHNFSRDDLRRKETLERYSAINHFIDGAIKENFTQLPKRWTQRLDHVFTHKLWGYLIFFAILFVIFQAIFAWSAVPMDFIDLTFSELGAYLSNNLPPGMLTNLLTEGIVPGIGGIVIFIPQIAILFAFIAILEETGYMSRVVFLMDKIMRKFGLNGKSVVPLISGVACAIPAIMATRTIENWKERLITIFVTPLMSCSARLPIYTILIALVVPDKHLFGWFLNLQGIALMAMYLLGFIMAILSAVVMKLLLKSKDRSFLVMELPTYKIPRWKNVGLTMYEKSKTFVFEAGKIIFAISIVLWVLATYGPGDRMSKAEEVVQQRYEVASMSEEEYQNRIESVKLENSYAGIFGKAIEPVITPLGYDWKIGIALITSFAAREVFVGTMATIYSIGNTDDESTIKNRMKNEVNLDTGQPRYTVATGLSLLVFYAFAMQCMSTLAIVYRETKGWKWPLIQLLYMSGLAYISAFIVYQVLS